jgi:hypothetical protein
VGLKRIMGIKPDPRVVATRRDELHSQGRVAYWLVVSYQDGLDLLAGKVPPAVRPQLLATLKRGRAESAAEYAARVSEARDRP